MSTVNDVREQSEICLRQLSGPVQTWFSTESVPPARRVAEWEAHHAESLVGLRTGLSPAADLRAEAATLRLPRLRIAKVVGSPHTVRRQAADIAAHPVTGAIAYIPLEGANAFNHRAGRFVVGPGRVLICDGDAEFARDLSEGVNELVLHVPRTVLREMTGSSSVGRPTLINLQHDLTLHTANRELAKLADGALLRGLWRGERLETRLLELLGTLFARSAIERTPVEDALSTIAEYHQDPEFNGSALARRIGISERQLSRLFAEVGLSVPRAVLAARLDTAHKKLTDASSSKVSMAEIAAHSGFRSQAQFSRSYHARFGVTPLRHRKQLLVSSS
ncbi:AraC family transcriptional regulator [Brevibacterium siliguriense]|nr:helix-turn-helix transcriptional regulator [Brevibacterium siliguriense]